MDTPKIVVLNFLPLGAAPCLAEMPHLQQIADKYADHKEILFLVVGREESQETSMLLPPRTVTACRLSQTLKVACTPNLQQN